MPSTASWKLHSAGVDWITATATDQAVRSRLAKVGRRLLRAEDDGSQQQSPVRFQGYVGSKCGGVTVGERADSLLCQVSGSAASEYWLALLDTGANVTRLDVAVTCLSPHKRWDEAREQWERIDADGDLAREAGWRSYIVTRPTGATLYIGSPKSDRRLRLYDKHAESPHSYPTGAWRYEVQARSGLAGSIAAGLADRSSSTIASVATVHECFRARGVQPRFRAGGRGVLGSVPRTRSDAERKLRWIEQQVKPTVAWLASRGYRSDVRRILGVG